MAPTNVFFNHAVQSEHHLYEDLIVESLRMYGHECFYLPREIVEEDTILGEDIQSRFGDAYSVEMYLENVDGYEGEGDLFSKFGLEVRDQATFVISVRSWERFVSTDGNLVSSFRPNEGDLIYFPLSGSLFEIRFVEHEDPFYQVGKLFIFKMRCELFEYSGEDFDTGINADLVEIESAYTQEITLLAASGSGSYEKHEAISGTADRATGTASISGGAVTSVSIVSQGDGYTSAPTVTFSAAPEGGTTATGTAVIGENKVLSVTITEAGSGYTAAPTVTFAVSPADTVVAEVNMFRVDDGGSMILTLQQIQRTIQVGETLTGAVSGAAYEVLSVGSEIALPNDDTNQNEDFETKGDSYLDFSETNPFGEPT